MKFGPDISVDDFVLVQHVLPVLVKETGIAVYDFQFRVHFETTSVFQSPPQPVVARIGPVTDYDSFYNALLVQDITLIHTPEEHNRCSLISHWYVLLDEFTPRTKVYHELPSASQVESDFGWPVFVKGERQTSKHKASTSIIRNAAQFETLLETWKTDPILHWQKMVCREFIPLEHVETTAADRIPASKEFRLFYWKKQRAGWGRYWYENAFYTLDAAQQQEVFELADRIAERVNVTFLAIDIARTANGKWILIEINDGQESGCAGADQRLLWETIVKLESAKTPNK